MTPHPPTSPQEVWQAAVNERLAALDGFPPGSFLAFECRVPNEFQDLLYGHPRALRCHGPTMAQWCQENGIRYDTTRRHWVFTECVVIPADAAEEMLVKMRWG